MENFAYKYGNNFYLFLPMILCSGIKIFLVWLTLTGDCPRLPQYGVHAKSHYFASKLPSK